MDSQSTLETSQTEFVEREIEAEKQVTALENVGRRLKVSARRGILSPDHLLFPLLCTHPVGTDGMGERMSDLGTLCTVVTGGREGRKVL